MDALPGTPQIQNIIPTNYFGTDTYAAPLIGIIGAIMVFTGGMIWLEHRRKQALAKGEGYGEGHTNEPESGEQQNLPNFWLSIVPLVLVVAFNFAFSRSAISVKNWYDGTMLKETFNIADVSSVTSSWSLIVALTIGILAPMLLNVGRIKVKLASGLTAAAMGSLLAIFNTASEVGFGNVVKTLPGFSVIQNWVFNARIHSFRSSRCQCAIRNYRICFWWTFHCIRGNGKSLLAGGTNCWVQPGNASSYCFHGIRRDGYAST